MSSQELQPLLYDGPKKPTPLPKAQLATIYAIKLTLPIALTQVLPYFNVLIEKLAVSRGADTGYYSGLAVSGLLVLHLEQQVVLNDTIA